ncbi:hypothetical protein ACFFLZ_06430 [Photobacterium aphoticum]|uniref:Uncharacterized protein n=1 Tax=Photobacterium aphoticum TaxID=754436 RepID=A0A0J1GQD4_9GAMM|nr:hypothetical protein [Photobacterium aphoticum]KLV01998.1 hypothetical protein ABT58_06330 [Photobacterium aphoticum]PSU60244.1 hypothetical protein C9I90_01085 [Photobacterium aphoticum]GHA34322.1 hypothetical protein GCM10007086_04710 [Photobacterium aphoticum]
MSFHQLMQPRQRSQFQAVGEFLYIETCTSKVRISTERGEYTLRTGAQIIDPKLAGVVTVENLGEAGNVTIVCGFGRYIPPSDGQQVAVTAMPAMSFAPGQSVAVSELPRVALVDGQAVVISELPAVSLAENQQVTVSRLPSISLADGQTINVTNTAPLQTKPVGGDGAVGNVLTIASNAATLAGNPSRCHVLLKASTTNTNGITVNGGWTLAAGETLQLNTTAALTFAGTDGDTLETIEITR